jgi:hypothetical protein
MHPAQETSGATRKIKVASIVMSNGQQIPESGHRPFDAAPSFALPEVTNAEKIPPGCRRSGHTS